MAAIPRGKKERSRPLCMGAAAQEGNRYENSDLFGYRRWAVGRDGLFLQMDRNAVGQPVAAGANLRITLVHRGWLEHVGRSHISRLFVFARNADFSADFSGAVWNRCAHHLQIPVIGNWNDECSHDGWDET